MVTITGTDFTGVTGVTFGGTAATGVTLVNATTITATAPAKAAGSVSVRVTTPLGTSSVNTVVTYAAPPSTPVLVTPANGASITQLRPMISGTASSGTVTVYIDGASVGTTTASGGTWSYTPTSDLSAATHTVRATVTNPAGLTSANSNTNTFIVDTAPTISSVSPIQGPASGGTTITITGTNLNGTTGVKVNGVAATSVNNVSATQVTAITPASADGTFDVEVTTAGGTATSSGAFTYVAAPSISGIQTGGGAAAPFSQIALTDGGETLYVNGANLAVVTAVTIDGAPVSFGNASASQLEITTPSMTEGTKTIEVTSPGGQASNNSLTVIARPTLTGVAYQSGTRTANNLQLTLTGTGFVSGEMTVRFGADLAQVAVSNSTTMTVVPPSGFANGATITLARRGLAAANAPTYNYVLQPRITNISPASGPASGGTTVVLTGTEFNDVTGVTIGGNAASIRSQNSTSVEIDTPAGTAGAADVVVASAGGVSTTSAGGFTYQAAPTLSALSPSGGSTGGGTTVTATGTGFVAGDTSVTIGGTTIPAGSVTVNSATSLSFDTPAHAAGNVSVTATTAAGTSGAAPGGYTYANSPTATSLAPALGPIAGGTSVTITGTNFVPGATSVTIGGNTVGAGSVTVNSATSLTFSTPAHADGSVAVTVTTPGGTTSAVPGGFVYAASYAPPILNASWSSSSVASGATVDLVLTVTNPGSDSYAQLVVGNGMISQHILPSGLTTVGSVTGCNAFLVDGTNSFMAVTSGSLASGATCQFTVPLRAQTAGSYSLTDLGVNYVNWDGSQNLGAMFSVPTLTVTQAEPTVSSVTPNVGPTSGGGLVTILGTHFIGSVGVTIGGNAASDVTVVNPTVLTARVPSGTAGTASVVVTNAGGGNTANSLYTYLAASTATATTVSAVAYNTGSATATTFSLASFATGSPTGYAVGSSTTTFGGTVSIDSAGLVSYTPPAGFRGNDTFTFTATNGGGTSSAATITVPVSNPIFALTLPSATASVGAAYSGSAVVAGGKALYSSFSATGLPNGVTLDTNGVFSGAPTAVGSFAVTVTVTDASIGTGPYTSTATASLSVSKGAQTINATDPGIVNVGQSVSMTATATSGLAVTFATSTPANCTVSSTGSILGVAAGVCNVAVNQAGDGNWNAASQRTLGVDIAQATQTITFASVSNASLSASPLTLSATASSGLSVVFNSATPGICTVSGTSLTLLATGTCTINADQAGNGTYAVAPQVQRSFLVTPATLAVTAAAPTGTTVGAAYSQANPASGGTAPYTYALATGALPAGTSLGATGVVSGTATTAGAFSYAIRATDSQGSPVSATGATVSGTIARGNQTITFGSLSNASLSASPLTLSATASSGLAVSFSSATPGICTVSGTSLTLLATGTCTVDADQAGGSNYNAAPQVQRSFPVTPATLAVTAAAPTGATVGGAYSQANPASGGVGPYTYLATGTLPWGTSLNTSTGEVSGAPASAAFFAYAIRATDSQGSPVTATGATVSVSIAVGSQTITFANPGTQTFGSNVVVAATVNSGLPAVFSSATPGVCTVNSLNNSLVNFVSTGTCTINANQAGNSNYTAAPQVQQSFTIAAGSQTITFANPGTQTFGSGATAAATASSALPVTFTSGTAPVCTVTAGGAVSFVTAGTCTIHADQAGDGSYGAASRVSQSFTVNKANQMIAFDPLAPASLSASPLTLPATANSGLSVSFASASETICTVSGSTLTLLRVGTCTIEATQAGNGSWNAAPQVSRSFTVTPATLIITTGAPAGTTVGASFTQGNTASGGTAPYTYVVASGPLPAWATLNPTTGIVSGTPTAVGAFSYSIQATDSQGSPVTATGTTVSGTIARGDQTISYNGPGPLLFGATPTVTATASSGLVVTFSTATSDVCTITAGGAVTLLGVGTCTLNVNQAGNGNYNAAPQVQQSFVVSATRPTVIGGYGGPAAGGTVITLTGTDFLGASSVTIGGASATNVSVLSATQIRLTTPAGAVGNAAIVVTTPGGTSTGGGYVYTRPIDVVAGLGASLLTVGEGTTLTLTIVNPTNFVESPALTLSLPEGLVIASPNGLTNSCGGSVSAPAGASSLTLTEGFLYSVQTCVLTVNVTATTAGAKTLSGTLRTSGGTSTFSASLTVKAAIPTVADKTGVRVEYNSAGTAIDLAASITGDHSAITVATAPAHGTTTVAGDVVTYKPTTGYLGTDSFTYTATGVGGVSTPATVSLTVFAPAPVAVADAAGTPANQPVAVQAAANDTGLITSLVVTTAPAHGTAVVNGLAITYTPADNYFGADTLSYKAVGPGGESAPAVVTLTVAALPPPVAPPLTATALNGTTTGGSITFHIAPDGTSTQSRNTGLDGEGYSAQAVVVTDYTVSIVTHPAHGTAVVNGHNIIYTPNPGYSGPDPFTYRITNVFGSSAPANIAVTVVLPPAGKALTARTQAHTPVTVEITAGAQHGPFVAASIVSVTQGSGTATLAAMAGQTGRYEVTFTPTSSFSGNAVVTYTLTSVFATSAPATLTITVDPRPDPGLDPDVKGLIGSQNEATKRFATAQIQNFARRLEQLHGGGEGGFASRSSFAVNLDGGVFDPNRVLEDPRDTRNPIRDAAMQNPGFQALGRETTGDLAVSTSGKSLSPVSKLGQELMSDGTSVWASGTVTLGRRSTVAGQSGVKFTTNGLSAGLDRAFGKRLVLGVGAGWGETDDEVGTVGSHSGAKSWMGVVYGSFNPVTNLYVDGQIGYGGLDFTSRRQTAGAMVYGQRDGSLTTGALSVAWEHRDGALHLSPYGRLELTRGSLDRFTETGDPLWALTYGEQKATSVMGVLGARGDYVFTKDWGEFSPSFRVEYRYDFNGSQSSTLEYADLIGGPIFVVTPNLAKRDNLVLGLGAEWAIKDSWKLSLDLDGGLSNGDQQATRYTLKARKGF